MRAWLLVLLFPCLVSAQDRSRPDGVPAETETQDDATRDRARRLIEEGTHAFEQHDYAHALSVWREAYALGYATRQVEQLRYNIGLCLERLARFREAAVEYEAAANGRSLTDQQRSQARTSLATVRARLGTLVVEGPRGQARIDDALTCQLPCEVMLDPGRHTVVLQGADASRRTVTLQRGTTERLVFAAVPDLDVAGARPVDRESTGFEPSALFWVGLGTAVVGGAATLGLGLRTLALRDDFDAMPNGDLADEGELMRNLTNFAAIPVLAVGGALMLIDLVLQLVNDSARD